MSSKAPTPFGGFGKTTSTGTGAKTSKAASTSAAFPPMSASAPTPFGGGAAAATKKTPSSSSAFPPMSSKAPTPFVDTEKSSKIYVAASEYEAQFWSLVRDTESFLSDVSTQEESLTDSPTLVEKLHDNVEDIVRSIEKLSSSMNIVQDGLHEQREGSILLLSRRDDLARQIEESQQILKLHFDLDFSSESTVSKSQSLDIESEKTRRQLVGKTLDMQKSISRLREQISLLSRMMPAPSPVKSSIFSWTPSRRTRKFTGVTGTRALLESLKSGYDRSKHLEDASKNLSSKVDASISIRSSFASDISIVEKASNRGRCNKTKISALPFSSPVSFAKTAKSKGTISTTKVLRLLKQNHQIKPKKFDRHDLDFNSERKEGKPLDTYSWRSNNSSKLMGTLGSAKSQSSALLKLSVGSTRNAWQSTDLKSMNSTKLSLPTTLKQIDAKSAAKQALVPFGTSPDKMSSVHKINQRQQQSMDEMVAAKEGHGKGRGTTSSSTSISNLLSSSKGPRSESSQHPVNSFTALGKSSMKFVPETIESDAPRDRKKSDQTSKVPAFPPLSAKAPTLFGSKKKDLKMKEQKEGLSSGIFGKSTLPTGKDKDEQIKSKNETK